MFNKVEIVKKWLLFQNFNSITFLFQYKWLKLVARGQLGDFERVFSISVICVIVMTLSNAIMLQILIVHTLIQSKHKAICHKYAL